MHFLLRLVAMIAIFVVTSICWIVLGGVMEHRSGERSLDLQRNVSELWGNAQTQQAPGLQFKWLETTTRSEPVTDASGQVLRDAHGQPMEQTVRRLESRHRAVVPEQSRVDVGLSLDQRRKGLVWFSLYDVDFRGQWLYRHEEERSGDLVISFTFPDQSGSYDAFTLQVDGEEWAERAEPVSGAMRVAVPVEPGQEVAFTIGYRSRGRDVWAYRPTEGVGQVEDLVLRMKTDFEEIDFPGQSLSPSTKEQRDGGWVLTWAFERMVTGSAMGMVMPERVQPGELGARMSVSAPISLGLFMVWILVLGMLRGIEIHPVNHVFLAAAFFSFHLLFGYLADHVPVEWAFGLSAVVSVGLVVSYLRLAVGVRFALVEAGLAQLVYLVGFSLAHFWDGFTGLTVTVMGILTLFAMMQLTGRTRWSEVLSGGSAARSAGGEARTG